MKTQIYAAPAVKGLNIEYININNSGQTLPLGKDFCQVLYNFQPPKI